MYALKVVEAVPTVKSSLTTPEPDKLTEPPLQTPLALALAETPLGAELTVPEAATFCELAFVEEQTTLPDGLPEAELVNRT